MHEVQEFIATESDCIGLCLGYEEGDELGLHVGILHHVHGGFPRFLNLGFHYLLRYDPIYQVKPTYRWLFLRADTLLKQSLSGWCQRLTKRSPQGYPYGLNAIQSTFNKEGKLMLADNEHGLSCATFVLKVLEYGGIHLVDYSSWPDPDETDTDAQNRLVKLLEGFGASAAHVRNVAGEIGSKRIRPEQVAACAPMYDNASIIHDECYPMGEALRRCLPVPI